MSNLTELSSCLCVPIWLPGRLFAALWAGVCRALSSVDVISIPRSLLSGTAATGRANRVDEAAMLQL